MRSEIKAAYFLVIILDLISPTPLVQAQAPRMGGTKVGGNELGERGNRNSQSEIYSLPSKDRSASPGKGGRTVTGINDKDLRDSNKRGAVDAYINIDRQRAETNGAPGNANVSQGTDFREAN